MEVAVDETNGALCAQWVKLTPKFIIHTRATKINTWGSKKDPICVQKQLSIIKRSHMTSTKVIKQQPMTEDFSSKAHYKKWYKKDFFSILGIPF